ncbi:MAG: YggT family protein [bacterium]|nr:YggT family protein [bacterium]
MTSIGSLLVWILQLYSFLIIARAIMSFFPVDPYNPLVKFLFDITEPVLQPVRDVMRQQFAPGMGLDFSPMIVLIVIQILIQLVVAVF